MLSLSPASPLRTSRPGRAGQTQLLVLLLAAAVAGTCGVVVHRHGFVILCAIGCLLAVGVGWPWLTIRSLRATLCFLHDRCREGEPVTVELRVQNRGPLPVDGIRLVGLHGHAAVRIALPPLSTRTLRWKFVPPSRGIYPAAGVGIECGFPFGLWHARRSVTVERRLLAWPAHVPLPAAADLSVAPMEMGRVHRVLSSGIECVGVRPYRRGDAVKLVHRAQTARHDRLLVREVSGAAEPRCRIVLDSAAASYANPAVREKAIRTAATLFEAMLSRGEKPELVVEGRRLPVAASLSQALDTLANISAVGGPLLAVLLRDAVCRPGDASIVIITSEAAADALPTNDNRVIRILTVDSEPHGLASADSSPEAPLLGALN